MGCLAWLRPCGEIVGSATAAFITTKARLEQEDQIEATDFCPTETKQLIAKNLQECQPSSEDLDIWGRRGTLNNLKKNSYFGALLAIDGNTKSTRRTLCLIALKTAAKCICSGYYVDGLRAVTYSYLALNYLD